MTKASFLRVIQHRTARAAVSASATRGQGTPGVVKAARQFCMTLKLRPFGTGNERAFLRALDAATAKLVSTLPKGAASWGLARKLLSIFVRDSFYTGYLAEAYHLEEAEDFLEIPLESITAKRLQCEMPGVPRWPGVKYLQPDIGAQYQEAANLIAKRKRVARVHLDAYWWGARE